MLGSVLLSIGVRAVTPDVAGSPYNGIVERNVFNLHDPPKPPDPADLIKKDPLPKITLTGITTILGRKVTFLTIPAAKPGGVAESFMLAEGQAQNEIEVKQIDEKAGVVKVSNHGEAQSLDFDHDGAKPVGPPPPAIQPPTFPRAGLPPPQPVLRPLRPFNQNQGQRNVPLSRNGSAIDNAMAPMNGASQNQSQAPLTAEQATALIEIQRMKMQQEGDPTAQIMPPTEMTQPQ